MKTPNVPNRANDNHRQPTQWSEPILKGSNYKKDKPFTEKRGPHDPDPNKGYGDKNKGWGGAKAKPKGPNPTKPWGAAKKVPK